MAELARNMKNRTAEKTKNLLILFGDEIHFFDKITMQRRVTRLNKSISVIHPAVNVISVSNTPSSERKQCKEYMQR